MTFLSRITLGKYSKMPREKFNDTQKEILRIYRETSKRKRGRDFNLTRKELSRLFFRRPETKRSGHGLHFPSQEGGIEKSYQGMKYPHRLETEKQAWTRRASDQQRSDRDVTDWRERVGLNTGLRGIYSKK